MIPFETPSWLTSWVAWRNRFTKPGETPFNLLINQLGSLSSAAYTDAHETCPYCNDYGEVNHSVHGRIYCVCVVLPYIETIKEKYAEITASGPTSKLSDLSRPTGIGRGNQAVYKKAIGAANSFIKSPTQWLGFMGHNGTGKTHILLSITQSFYPLCVYMPTNHLENLVHANRSKLNDLYDLLKYAPILAFDDIGIEYGGPLVKSALDAIVDYRYSQRPKYPTLYASNMTWKQFFSYLPRVADRFIDTSIGEYFEMTWRSERWATILEES